MLAKTTVDELRTSQPELVQNFPGYSVYPAAAANLGPQTVSFEHNDSENSPELPCMITAAGNYNPDIGGHIYFWDLKLIIRFPPGATVATSSACIRHGNTPIRSYESRYSFTQYFPGGLVRWNSNNRKPVNQFTEAESKVYYSVGSKRIKDAISIFSKVDELEQDRLELLRKEKSSKSIV